MKLVKCMGATFPKGTNAVVLSTVLSKELGLRSGGKIRVQAGLGKTVTAHIIINHQSQENALWLTSDLRVKLHIPGGVCLSAKIDVEKRSVEIGPVFALFATRVPARPREGRQPSDPSRFMQELVRHSPGKGVLTYLITPGSINWNNNEVRGYLYDFERCEWYPRNLPMPNVVYDRLNSRKSESLRSVQNTKKNLLNTPGIKYFNPKFLNKWECHRLLWSNPEVMPYIPKTQRFLSIKGLVEFINLHRVIYLKPSGGSLGKGIIRIAKLGNNTFQCKYRVSGTGTITRVLSDANALKQLLRRICGGKVYIMQQGLALQTFRGAPFDIRILMQKNHKGEWCRTKMLARVARKGSITSNLSSGASAELVAEVLKKVFGEEPYKPGGLGNRLRSLGNLVAEALESAMGLCFGELGIDLGVDVRGNVWLIEVNSKPFKAMETEKGSENIIRNSIFRPIGYAKYLWETAGEETPVSADTEEPGN